MSRNGLPNPLRSNPVSPRTSTYPPPPSSMPISPPSTVTSPYGNLLSPYNKSLLPSLMPLPLSPMTLKPSTKPPTSLNAPNPTTRTNFSPTTPPGDFPRAFPISGYSHNTMVPTSRTVSHSASASISTPGPPQTQRNGLKHRSPSQPHLPTYFSSSNASTSATPPSIPLRISSIPTNNKPRKLSLPIHRSMSTLKPPKSNFDEKENILSPVQTTGSMTPRKITPPLRTNKELPSPPLTREEELRTREKVMGSSPQAEWSTYATATTTSPQRRVSDSNNRGGQVWNYEEDPGHPGIAELPAAPAQREKTHSRLHSAPVSASLQSSYLGPDVQALTAQGSTQRAQTHPSAKQIYPESPPQPLDSAIVPTSTPKTTSKLTPHSSKHMSNQHASTSKPKPQGKSKPAEPGNQSSTAHDARPVQMSRTQKDKDRKKRSKAKVLMEHVDIIRDEFWEKRPWILSGKAG